MCCSGSVSFIMPFVSVFISSATKHFLQGRYVHYYSKSYDYLFLRVVVSFELIFPAFALTSRRHHRHIAFKVTQLFSQTRRHWQV